MEFDYEAINAHNESAVKRFRERQGNGPVKKEIFRLVINGIAKDWHDVDSVSPGFLDRLARYATARPYRDIIIERRNVWTLRKGN